LRAKDKYGVELEFIKVDPEGNVDMNDAEKKIDENTKLVSITHISNVIGNIMPINEIGKIAHENNALFLVDAAQSIGHIKIDVRNLNCDFLVASGRKGLMGPLGSGFLFCRKNYLETLEPMCVGGGAVRDVSLTTFKLEDLPERFEAGVPNIIAGIALGAAVDYVNKIGINNIEKYERSLTKELLTQMTNIDKLQIYGPKELNKRIGIIGFNIQGISPQEVSLLLDELGRIGIRSGHHCAIPFVRNVLNAKEGTARVSLHCYNNQEDIAAFISTIKQIIQNLT
jgi:cysteine desulfurase/selenocysteine lyase